ncbi:hypothetical protein PFICI_12416 [Pestalotiopsis fici W106-1]|uniref:Uncharacterized protein n=1 Tax=Pestalotiopsis fici (strain W106-1 / CGMCC3.15140) TaxID=1229662 RepID=W3WQP8_PESFW|nr:uncharacterized protein PFICI_12416 [Pestalotiopsis fici W106-1]ETS75472.1 hypothetical protein PFICI_12416 [Pestalotiopsis fici W106-1]
MSFTSFLITLMLAGHPVSAGGFQGSPQPLIRQSAQGILFGPITLPTAPLVSNITINLINFNDEVFDISSISVFGDINDGGCGEVEDTAPESYAGQSVVLGPTSAAWDAALISNAQVSLINFNDEVFDISSISVFGDINDGVCQPATGTR